MLRRTYTGTLLALATLGASSASAAAPAEHEIKARHQALSAAISRKDLKAAREFYTADYYAEVRGQKSRLDERMKAMADLFSAADKLQVNSSLSGLVVKGNTATGSESIYMAFTMKDGTVDKSAPEKWMHRWQKVGGVWKLAWKKAVL